MGPIYPTGPQPPYPLHNSVKDKLHPDYVKFYNEHITHQQQVHLQPVSASRSSGILALGGGPMLPVGETQDFTIHRRETEGADIKLRAFTPSHSRPENGWPVMVYYHGGGWVLGNIDTENTVCTNLCARANCVVITVDYRLAPENPYPAAVHDAWEALLWVNTTGASVLHLNLLKTAVGGSSAGGNLAAIMCQKAASLPPSSANLVPKFLTQLLIVPVTNNTASIFNNFSWKENKYSPALPAAKMMWYRNHYLPDKKTWAQPEASPLLWTGNWGALPDALVVLGEMDVLRSEGEEFAEKLWKVGVGADLKIMKGMPHPFLAMDGVLQQGRDTITFMVGKLREAFEAK